MKKIILFVVLLMLLSCSNIEMPSEQDTGETDEAISDVDLDISDVGSLDKDLDMGELDDIDKDLEDISHGW